MKNLLEKNSHDSGLLWKTINDIVKFKHKSSSSPTQILTTNGITSSPAKISKAFNDHFTSIANSLAADIPIASNQYNCYPSSSISCALQSFFLKPVTDEQIAYHLLGLDCPKSTGIKGIPMKYIKLAEPFLIPILSKLFNASINQGSFPTVFKTAEVVPVFKSGSKQSLNNYRPISLLCSFSKLLENCLHDQLYKYFKSNNYFYKHQFDFRENLSTDIALHQIYEDFTTGIANKHVTCSVFLDLKKAFNTVDNDILIAKLQHCRIRGLPLQLICSYLSNRHHYTGIQNTPSKLKPLTRGVPQGFILAPLLFLISINDLPSACSLRIRLFADDANLTFSGKSTALLERKMNEEFLKVDDWMKANKLSLNYKKTLVVNKLKSQSSRLNIKIGNIKYYYYTSTANKIFGSNKMTT